MGSSPGENLATGWPSLSITNFVKFHFIKLNIVPACFSFKKLKLNYIFWCFNTVKKLKVGTDHWHYQHEHHHHKVKLKCFIDFLLYFPLLVSDSVSTFAPTLFTGFSLAKDPKVSFWQSIWRTRRYSLLISDERVLYIMENIAPAVMNGIEIGIAIWKFILT